MYTYITISHAMQLCKETIASWNHDLKMNFNFIADMYISEFKCVMWTIFQNNQDHITNLKIMILPHKGVTATAAIPKNKLVLVACTTNITIVKQSQLNNGICCGVAITDPHTNKDASIFINSKFDKAEQPCTSSGHAVKRDLRPEFINPYWHVGFTDKASEANMILSMVTTKGAHGHTIRIPTMRNTTPLQADTKLQYYRRDGNASKWPYDVEPPAKKAKTA